MIKQVSVRGDLNNTTETWYVESESELSQLSDDVPTGSVAMILNTTSGGLTLKMKDSSGNWVEI